MACKWLKEMVIDTWLLLNLIFYFFLFALNPDMFLTFIAGIHLSYSGLYCKFSQCVLTSSLVLDD